MQYRLVYNIGGGQTTAADGMGVTYRFDNFEDAKVAAGELLADLARPMGDAVNSSQDSSTITVAVAGDDGRHEWRLSGAGSAWTETVNALGTVAQQREDRRASEELRLLHESDERHHAGAVSGRVGASGDAPADDARNTDNGARSVKSAKNFRRDNSAAPGDES
jgi:hypothetical protein